MTKCDLCGTQKSDSYGSVFRIGTVCHRCSVLSLAGPSFSMSPNCPPVPDDADPEVIALERQGMQPLTPKEYDDWVARTGNPYPSGKAKVQDAFTQKKIEQWFTDQGGSVLCGVSPDPITFDVFRACAVKHPPSSEDIPGIDEKTAKLCRGRFFNTVPKTAVSRRCRLRSSGRPSFFRLPIRYPKILKAFSREWRSPAVLARA